MADGKAGLEVVNYLALDTAGVAPTITLSATFPLQPAVAEENKLARLLATVADDVQVRQVEFFIDGALVGADGSFPFEYYFTTPARTATKNSFTIQARATDTGGNSTLTGVVTVQLVPDATPPRVVRKYPDSGAILSDLTHVSARFSEPIQPATITPQSLQLVGAGPDRTLGTADDAVADSGTLSWDQNTATARLELAGKLPAGLYEVRLSPPIADLAGNTLALPVKWTFWIIGQTDTDGDGVPDDLELIMGLDPKNPSTFRDGKLDGDRDPDQDGLPTRWEVMFGYDPTKKDTDGNGTNDSLEDPDHDGVTNLEEFKHGTNPLNADSDGDGWDDNGEILQGTGPLDAGSQPPRTIESAVVGYLNAVPETVPAGTLKPVASPAVSYLNALPETIPAGTLKQVASLPVSYLNALPETVPAGTLKPVASPVVSYLNAIPEAVTSPRFVVSPIVSYQNQ